VVRFKSDAIAIGVGVDAHKLAQLKIEKIRGRIIGYSLVVTKTASY
jgi:hypothetical protein